MANAVNGPVGVSQVLAPLANFEASLQKALPLPPGPATVLSQVGLPALPMMAGLPGMPGATQAAAAATPCPNQGQCPYARR